MNPILGYSYEQPSLKYEQRTDYKLQGSKTTGNGNNLPLPDEANVNYFNTI